MGSKKLRKTIFAMILMFIVITGVIIVTNKDLLQKKFGMQENMQNNSVQNSSTQNEIAGQTEIAADRDSKQVGNDLYAFMQDETFFDPDIHYKSIETYSGRNVFMVMSSVAKDLRIMIVNSAGRLVTGTPFSVTIQGLGEYVDNNEDGIIYIDKLRAGEYSVYMNEAEGFRVPNTVTTIQVKQDIDYRVLEGVEYMMLTEDDVDASKEDTEVKGAEEEADGTENTLFEVLGQDARKGIDVSKWNQHIDWEAAKADGVEFAIIRCGYRGSSTGYLIIDPLYEENITGAINAGVPVGVYFFTQAINEIEAVEEASMVINLIAKYDVDYPVFLDSESAGGNGRADDLTTEQRTRNHKAFMQTIASAGYATGVYGSTNWLNNRVNMNELSNYNTWLAQYADVPTYEGYYHMWQYTSKGRIDGITTNVDLNLSYMNIDTSIAHSAYSMGYTGIVNGDTGNVPTD